MQPLTAPWKRSRSSIRLVRATKQTHMRAMSDYAGPVTTWNDAYGRELCARQQIWHVRGRHGRRSTQLVPSGECVSFVGFIVGSV